MRIIAIRGANLASLADPFAIVFDAEPLRGAGLFAITGETGAGKSTILDALCLALYDEYPRIAARGADESIPDPSGDWLRASDPRSILRRGAASGFAEVDFLARDGRAYRVRCELNRARGKAAGRLQQRRRSLVRLSPEGDPEETVATQIEAVKTEVERLTDLTCDQFRRTVLLAQGDFDAFLRADATERAALLEKITGTGIYAAISRAVFAGCKAAGETLSRLKERRDSIGLLSGDERDTLLAESEARRTERETHVAAIGRIDLLRGRIEHIGRARRAAQASADRGDEAQAAFARLQPERDEAAALDAAEPLRPVLARVEETARVSRACDDEVAGIRTQEETARAEALTRSQALNAARETFAECEAAIARLAPLWDEAAALDAAIAKARETLALDRAHLANRETEALAASQAARKLAAQRDEHAAKLTALREILTRDAGMSAIAERWSEIAEWFDKRRQFRDESGEAIRRCAAAADAREQAQNGERAEREAGASEAEERARLAAAEEEAALAYAGLDEEGVTRRAALLEAMAGLVDKLQGREAARNAALAALARAEADAGTHRAALSAAQDRITAARREEADLLARREEVSRLGDLADAAASDQARHLRAALLAGEPCPVCGAREHPHADAHDSDTFIRVLRERRDTLTRALAAIQNVIADQTRVEARARAGLDDAAVRADAARLSAGEAETAMAAIAAGWTDAAGECAEAFPFPSAVDAATCADLAAGLAQARAGLRKRIEEARALRATLARLRVARDLLDKRREERETRLGRLLASVRDADLVITAETQRLANLKDRIESLDRSLAPHLKACGLAGGDLDRHGEEIRAAMAARAKDHAGRVSEADRVTGELDATKQALAAAESAAQTALARRDDASETLRRSAAECDALAARRAPLLDGEETATHRGRHERARAVARTNLDDAAKAAASATEALARLEARLQAAGEAREKAQTAFILAQNAWRDALAAAGIAEGEARARLAVAPERRAALATMLAAAQKRRDDAQAERETCERLLAETLADGEPEETDAALQADRERLSALIESLDRAAGETQARLKADDAARAIAGTLDAEIAQAAEAARLWAEVDAAVGSARGDRFRRFAQSVTLDHLVAAANAHLVALSPRYRLERADGEGGRGREGGADLGLQIVDRDLADERRSTRSLSGGERFLTSLALALALCSLEGRGSFVDTLFIDEGFGTLDAATLDLAIDALEALQGQGRKVGVISHVDSMHARIPVQIRVEKRGGGKSRIRLTGPGDATM